MSQSEERSGQPVSAALSEVHARARTEAAQVLQLGTDRYIIFSDQHRGVRNGADDFRGCERAYNAALAYYDRMQYTLIVLGDADELWEERPASVLHQYQHTLELEAGFHQKGRYLRFWGNHDDLWQDEDAVARHLHPHFPGLQVREGLRLAVQDGADVLGELFLVHGHQGTRGSDRWSEWARLPVRYVWRNWQRLTGKSLNTPAQDWRLREAHDRAMYTWAAAQQTQQQKLILITGHTHRPVFCSKAHADQVMDDLRKLEAKLADAPEDDALRREVSACAAELEWIRAQGLERTGQEGDAAMKKPCYFNTGCCSFADGDITGLEIADGEIRLVRWPDDQERPRPQILAQAQLQDVFGELG